MREKPLIIKVNPPWYMVLYYIQTESVMCDGILWCQSIWINLTRIPESTTGIPTCKSQGRSWSGQGSWRRDGCIGPALACLPYTSRCAGSIFVQFVWLLFSCIHCVQKATQRERENIQALAHPTSSLQSISNRPLRGWKVSVLYLRRYRWV